MFLVFEGLDGSGKSSLMQGLESHLKASGIETYKTREPGGTPLGDELRHMILRKSDHPPVSRAELLMYEASRAQHVDEVILPKIKSKIWVLCDRFSASSIAFQAGGRSINLAQVEWLNHFATNGLEPDLTILLDISVEESEARRLKRENATGEGQDRIESEKRDFHERVRKGFLDQAVANPSKWLVLDARKTPNELLNELISKLNSLGLKNG